MSAKPDTNDQQDSNLTEDEAVNNTEVVDSEENIDDEALLQAEDQLAEKIKQAEKKAEESWEQLLRTKAEMENLRRRTEKDLENAHKYAIEKFVTELLPIIDSMEMGLNVEEASVDSMKQGMELTINMMKSAFDKFNIGIINPQDEKFDPELHQAMSMQPTEDVEPNTVIAVMQKGYTLNGRLVRPAMVMVSKAP